MSVATERADERDAGFMRRALTLAKKGWGQAAPNPMVGAVVVRENVVVGEGYHARYGEAHAEVEALRAAGDRARGATVYVSLEPCAHFGKTPPCVDALIAAGVARVVAATRDPSPPASGGAERLRAAGINVAFDVEAAAARELNAPFFHAVVSDRPRARNGPSRQSRADGTRRAAASGGACARRLHTPRPAAHHECGRPHGIG